MNRILYLAFFLSGGAGLIYEGTWGRYLALFLGHSAYAQVLVIGTYLGGMALGAYWVGKVVRRIRTPLRWYAGAEILLALGGLAFHPVFKGATELTFAQILPGLGHPILADGVRWGMALVLLLPQAILLGTTFPLMASGLIRGSGRGPGRPLALLYFVNSTGGAVGVLAGGFLLVGTFGLPGSLVTAALLNALAGVAALVVSRWQRLRGMADSEGRGESDGHESPPALAEVGPPRSGAAGLRHILLWVTFGTAVASFAYEIGWIRMLSLVMGSAAHSFEVMLSAFVLGLGIGAFLIRGKADESQGSIVRLAWIQGLMGLAALATLPLYPISFGAMASMVDGLPASDFGYLLFGLGRYGLAIVLMLPATILAGMTLPLITALLIREGGGEGAIGRVYGINTLGSVVGVLLSGLVLLPTLGLKGMIVSGAVLDMSLGALLLTLAPSFGLPRRLRTVGFAVFVGIGLTGAAAQVGIHLSPRLLLSGVFRYGALPDPSEPVLFYQDGRTATVGVHVAEPGPVGILTTNGKPDASLSLRWIEAQSEPRDPEPIVVQDESTQTLLALIPLAHTPGATSAAVIGHGSGLTGHLLLNSPALERMITVEIEPEILEASQAFYPANARVFEDPRSRFVLDDAKAYFARNPGRFDLIVSEPSNPWVSGTSNLFTVEFYDRVLESLAPGGLFAQWFHGYEMTDDLVNSVLAGMDRSFSDLRGYVIGPGDILVIASARGRVPPPEWGVFDLPGVRRDLAHIPPLTPTLLSSLAIFDSAIMGPYLLGQENINSDYHPYLEAGAEKARFLRSNAVGYREFWSNRVSLAAFSGREQRPFAEEWSSPIAGLWPGEVRAGGAWLRWARFQDIPLEEAPSEPNRGALELYRTYSVRINLGRPPPDWRRFSLLAAAVEHELHAGTAGVVDTLFYGGLFQFLRAHDAPLEARAAADFLFGVASYDHARASEATAILLAAWRRGEEWLPIGLLMDGGVLSRLALRDRAGAAEVLETLPWDSSDAPGGRLMRGEILRSLIPGESPPESPPPG